MASNYTSSYQLCQWEASDKVLRTDFNADNAKLDAALKANADAISGEVSAREAAVSSEASARAAADAAVSASVPKIAWGSYTGDGESERLIPLDFTPKVVLVCAEFGRMYEISDTLRTYQGGLATTGHPVMTTGSVSTEVLSVQENGFRVHYYSSSSSRTYIYTNGADMVCHYLAIG